MKVLIVGSGGREHAIAYSVAKSDKVDKIYCTPGNAGIAEFAECAPIGAMEFDKIVAFAKEKEIDLVISIPRDIVTDEKHNGYRVRRASIDLNIPLITNPRLAAAFVNAFCTVPLDSLDITAWDEY